MLEVVAAVITNAQGEVLVAQRDGGHLDGLWEFPGGKVETGETHEQALIREINEELMIDISVQRHICTVEQDYGHVAIRLHAYACTAITDNHELNVHSAARWVTQPELAQVTFAPADVQIARELNKGVRL